MVAGRIFACGRELGDMIFGMLFGRGGGGGEAREAREARQAGRFRARSCDLGFVDGFFGVEDGLEFGEVCGGLVGVVFELDGGFFGDIIGEDIEFLSSPESFDVGFCGSFEVVEAVEGIGDGVPEDEDAVVTHDEHFQFGVLEELCASRSFFFEGESSEVVIDGGSFEEGCGILVDGGEAWIFERCEDRCVDGMDMHDAGCVGEDFMDGCVQSPGGWIGGIFLGEGIGVVCV